MRRAFVVMTALPPTKGHQKLVEFAHELADSVELVLCTQPEEPFSRERLESLRSAFKHMRVNVHVLHRSIPQVPEQSATFWEMWRDILSSFGMVGEDIIVASESYGVKLAETMGVEFYPYDLKRSALNTRATNVRDNPREFFSDVLGDFQPHLMLKVTSLGFPEVSLKEVGGKVNAHVFFSYAENLLEASGGYSFSKAMEGEMALSRYSRGFRDRPFLLLKKDPLSFLWEANPGNVESQPLFGEAFKLRSELYVVGASEERRLWGFLKGLDLKYMVADDSSSDALVSSSVALLKNFFDDTRVFTYRRSGQ